MNANGSACMLSLHAMRVDVHAWRAIECLSMPKCGLRPSESEESEPRGSGANVPR